MLKKYSQRTAISILLILNAGCFNKILVTPIPFGGGGRTELVETTVQGEKPSSRCLFPGSVENKILLIPISGFIGEGSLINRNATTPGEIYRHLQKAQKDSAIKAILLKIDSPGGSVNASDLIYRLLSDFSRKNKIPVFAHIDGIGASGAYYVAMSSGHINARPASMTGSIGVILSNFSIKGLMDKLGIEYRSIQSSPGKDILSPFREMRPEEKEFLQKQVMQTYERFLSIILAQRSDKIPEARLREIANGNIYSPAEAIASGLIDSESYLDEYIEVIRKKLNQPSISVVTYVPENEFDTNIYEAGAQQTGMSDLLGLLGGIGGSRMYYLWEAGL